MHSEDQPFSNTLRMRTSVSLSHATIICRFNRYRLEVIPPAQQSPPIHIRLNLLVNPRDFAVAVFQSARCTEPSPVLSDDELLG